MRPFNWAFTHVIVASDIPSRKWCVVQRGARSATNEQKIVGLSEICLKLPFLRSSTIPLNNFNVPSFQLVYFPWKRPLATLFASSESGTWDFFASARFLGPSQMDVDIGDSTVSSSIGSKAIKLDGCGGLESQGRLISTREKAWVSSVLSGAHPDWILCVWYHWIAI